MKKKQGVEADAAAAAAATPIATRYSQVACKLATKEKYKQPALMAKNNALLSPLRCSLGLTYFSSVNKLHPFVRLKLVIHWKAH